MDQVNVEPVSAIPVGVAFATHLVPVRGRPKVGRPAAALSDDQESMEMAPPTTAEVEAAFGLMDNDLEETMMPWDGNPAWKTRANTPTGNRRSTSVAWKYVKRLDTDHPKIRDGYTHVCTIPGCGEGQEVEHANHRFLKLHKATQRTSSSTKAVGTFGHQAITAQPWISTPAIEHMKRFHSAKEGFHLVQKAGDREVRAFIRERKQINIHILLCCLPGRPVREPHDRIIRFAIFGSSKQHFKYKYSYVSWDYQSFGSSNVHPEPDFREASSSFGPGKVDCVRQRKASNQLSW